MQPGLESSPPWPDPPPPRGGFCTQEHCRSATPLPLTSAHLELARPHFPSCRWDCELWLPGRYPLTLQASHGMAGLPPVPTPPNLYRPALGQLEGATLSCWVLGAGCWMLAGLGCWTGLGWAGSPPQQGLANRPPFFSAISLVEFHPSLLLPLPFTPTSPFTTTTVSDASPAPARHRHILQPKAGLFLSPSRTYLAFAAILSPAPPGLFHDLHIDPNELHRPSQSSRHTLNPTGARASEQGV